MEEALIEEGVCIPLCKIGMEIVHIFKTTWNF